MSDPPRWEANQTGIAYLLGNHRLEHIQASVDAARGLVQQAALHLQSARTLAETSDHSMAFIAAYDAARKSLTAILAAQGLRASGGTGGHLVLLDAVRPQFPDHRRELQRFDWLRTTRNQAQYPDFDTPGVTAEDVASAIPAAESIVQLAGAYLASLPD